MDPTIAELRAQIKLCEEFISLCTRIKKLEKLQNVQLPTKRAKLEIACAEVSSQLQVVTNELHNLEGVLNNRNRPMGATEQEELKELIKTARIRVGSLELFGSESTQQIQRIDEDMSKNALELDHLYPRLEEAILTNGFDPNTVEETVAELRGKRTILSDAIREEISSRRSQGKKTEQQEKQQQVIEGSPIFEAAFYEALVADLAQAQTSVELVCPQVTMARVQQIMPYLGQLAAAGRNVVIYIPPPDARDPDSKAVTQRIVVYAHQLLITVVQRDGIQYNAAVIDNVICWEGTISILGTSQPKDSMRRTEASSHVRELRHFLFHELR